jgi:F-type H+-transporting ATPase subunit epsilon
VEILPPDESEQNYRVLAAVSGGFLSVANDRVSILAAQAELGDAVDTGQARQELDASQAASGEESPEAKYARAQLRAAGEQA